MHFQASLKQWKRAEQKRAFWVTRQKQPLRVLGQLNFLGKVKIAKSLPASLQMFNFKAG